ncbi:MAG: DUF1287 domain-containing protein [Armatimonadetes bacterium]|nr:DUF1287 domain-containing protein [Armatimonadota bacterium]
MKLAWVLLLCLLVLPAPAQELSARQKKLLQGARSCLGDAYDAGYYEGGPPPRGRGACPEVVYYALKAAGIDLQERVDQDILAHPELYPNRRDRNIDYRWCPNLIVWFRRHTTRLPLDGPWQAGDVVFWSLLDDGVADHVGMVSDRQSHRGASCVVHNFPPRCTEEPVLSRWRIVGHFRLK